MRRLYRPGVLEQVKEIVDYFNEEHPALGHRFSADLNSTLVRLEHFPRSAAVVYRDARRTSLQDFRNYLVIYRYWEREDVLMVISVVHAARDPETWKRRV